MMACTNIGNTEEFSRAEWNDYDSKFLVVYKQARKQRGTGTHEKQRDERAWLNKITPIFLKNNYQRMRMANLGRNM
jgi:hypothetical protein